MSKIQECARAFAAVEDAARFAARAAIDAPEGSAEQKAWQIRAEILAGVRIAATLAWNQGTDSDQEFDTLAKHLGQLAALPEVQEASSR